MRRFAIICAALMLYTIASGQEEAPKFRTDIQYNAKMLKPVASQKCSYSDRFISISFVIANRILFTLENKTDNPLEIDWAHASYVDFNSLAHPVIHQGVRYIDRDKAPAPTVIPPMAKVLDTIHPSD